MNPRRAVLVCGILSAAGWAFLSAMTHGLPDGVTSILSTLTFHHFPGAIAETKNGFGYEIKNHTTPTTAYLTVHFCLFGLAILPLISIVRAGQSGFDRRLLIIIFTFAATFRALLLPSTPIHENDFYRYLWDGKSLSNGVNPYLFPPRDVISKADPLGEFFSAPLAERRSFDTLTPDQTEALETLVTLHSEHPEILTRIGHPHIPTIYPPVSQASFWANDRISGGSILGWKCLVILFDLGTCVVIAILLSTVGKNPSMVILYAWSPLVVKEFANSGHHDSVPIFLTVLAILLAVRRRHFASVVALALGTLGKFLPVALLPILSPPSKNAPPWLRYILFAAIVSFAFFPFLLWQNAGFAGVFSGLHTYNQGWEFFGGIFALIHRAVQVFTTDISLYPAKIITAILFAAIVTWITFSKPRNAPGLPLIRKCSVVFGAFFLLNASAFPWYFAWVAPFLCFFPHPAWIALSGLLPLTYLSFHPASDLPLASADWLGFPALSWIIWGGFVSVLVAQRLYSRLAASAKFAA